MNTPRTRREFLAEVGRGMLATTVGFEVASGLGLSPALAAETPEALSFGALEPLVCFMQETPVDKLLPALTAKLKAGTELKQLVAAAALANARTFGGDPRPVFDLMLRYAVSEDGSLHGEKFYRTSVEEFAASRPAYRWRYLVALARVTASEYGRPAPGVAEARALLKLA